MILSIGLYILILSLVTPLLGKYIAAVYQGKKLIKPLYKLENFILSCLKNNRQQTWNEYFRSLITFNILCFLFTFLVLYFQNYLWVDQVEPLNFAAAFNAAISFTTNTFWQSHKPETELNYVSHILALTLENFLAAGVGITVFIAFTRGMMNDKNPHIGNFYQDYVRAQIHILLPIAFIIAVFLLSQGVPHDFTKVMSFENIDGNADQIVVGPVAGQVAIKIFASNGGSIFQASSAHPYEAPNQFTFIVELILILILPLSLLFTYGYLVEEIKLSWVLYNVILFFICISTGFTYFSENKFGFTFFINENWDNKFNLIGKEILQEELPSILWTTLSTTSSLGSQNNLIDSFSPLSIFVLLGNLIIGKFILDNVASGFFTMLIYIIITVFIRGLIVGQPPTFLDKKISIKEINYIMISSLIFPIGVVLFSSITITLPWAEELIIHHGPRAISELAFNFSSLFSNNGSTMQGMNIRSNYFNLVGSIAMLIGRYPTIYYALAVAGSFAEKNKVIDTYSFKTSGLEFSVMLSSIILLMGALTFFPILLLGPVLEFMNLLSIQE